MKIDQYTDRSTVFPLHLIVYRCVLANLALWRKCVENVPGIIYNAIDMYSSLNYGEVMMNINKAISIEVYNKFSIFDVGGAAAPAQDSFSPLYHRTLFPPSRDLFIQV